MANFLKAALEVIGKKNDLESLMMWWRFQIRIRNLTKCHTQCLE